MDDKYVTVPCWECNGAIPRSYAPEDVCPRCGSIWRVPVDIERLMNSQLVRDLTALALAKEAK